MIFHGHFRRISKLVRQQVMEPNTPVYKGPEKPDKGSKKCSFDICQYLPKLHVLNGQPIG